MLKLVDGNVVEYDGQKFTYTFHGNYDPTFDIAEKEQMTIKLVASSESYAWDKLTSLIGADAISIGQFRLANVENYT